MKLDFHAHFNVNDPGEIRNYVEACKKNETVTAIVGGSNYGGYDYVSNEEVIRHCKEYSAWLIPVAKLELWDKPDPSEVRKWADAGAKGFKCIYPYYEYDHDLYMPVYEEIEKTGLPVLFHTGNYRPHPADAVFRRPVLRNMHPITLDRIARSFPNMNIVMAHLGTSVFRELAMEIVKIHRNLYFDLAGCGAFWGVSPHDLANLFQGETSYRTDSSAYRKMIFGSDSYINKTGTQTQALDAYRRIICQNRISDEDAAMIMGGTAASWMGIKL